MPDTHTQRPRAARPLERDRVLGMPGGQFKPNACRVAGAWRRGMRHSLTSRPRADIGRVRCCAINPRSCGEPEGGGPQRMTQALLGSWEPCPPCRTWDRQSSQGFSYGSVEGRSHSHCRVKMVPALNSMAVSSGPWPSHAPRPARFAAMYELPRNHTVFQLRTA